MTDIKGGVAVITGAASGIGRTTALLLAKRGCHLALSDVNAPGVAAVADEAQAQGVRATAHALDVADRQAIHAYADTVAGAHGGATILVNNAGVALSQRVEHMDHADWAWLMDINFWGVVNGTHAFLPQLQAARGAHVVNVSSLFGLIGVPTQAAYCAAKFAVRGFSESLRAEMQGSGVNVTSVHPGGIKTNIAAASRFTDGHGAASKDEAVAQFDKLAITSPQTAAEKIVRGIERNRPRVVIGPDAKLLMWLERVHPQGYHWLLRRQLARKH